MRKQTERKKYTSTRDPPICVYQHPRRKKKKGNINDEDKERERVEKERIKEEGQ